VGRFDNKVAIVTGGGSGIGHATVLRLATEGASVVVADINAEAAAAVADEVTAAGGTAISVPTDVSDEAAVSSLVDQAVEHFGGLDVLHNNAALQAADFLARDLNILGFDREVFDRAMAVNLVGPILGCKYAIPKLQERGGGAIVNTASVAALRGEHRLPVYAMTKAGVTALTRFVATQYGKDNIRCNAVAPGTTLTPAARANNTEERLQQRLSTVLTVRLGEPEDIAAAVAFLASEDAAYITGQTIVADGGRIIHS
jgi:NAD(P)-dependent dehydrogenase (short-subunit alcohol dehydrogenase family)